jgi:hypothetical protein
MRFIFLGKWMKMPQVQMAIPMRVPMPTMSIQIEYLPKRSLTRTFIKLLHYGQKGAKIPFSTSRFDLE